MSTMYVPGRHFMVNEHYLESLLSLLHAELSTSEAAKLISQKPVKRYIDAQIGSTGFLDPTTQPNLPASLPNALVVACIATLARKQGKDVQKGVASILGSYGVLVPV